MYLLVVTSHISCVRDAWETYVCSASVDLILTAKIATAVNPLATIKTILLLTASCLVIVNLTIHTKPVNLIRCFVNI